MARAGLLALALLGAAVLSLDLLSMQLTRFNGHPSALWPANALVIAALLRNSGRRWPAILITGLVAELTARLVWGDPARLAAGLAGSDGLEILICVAGVRRFIGATVDLTRMRHLLTFLVFGGLVGPVVAAGAAAWVRGFGGVVAVEDFAAWFTTRSLSVLILTPALLVMSAKALRPLFERPNLGRTLVAAVLLVADLAIVFGQSRYPAGFLMMPILLVIIVQLGGAGGALALLITAVVGVYFTLNGMGVASVVAGGMGKQLLMLQLFLLVLATSILPVGAVRDGRRRIEAQLKAALDDAHAASALAADATRLAELATRIAHLGHWRHDLATGASIWSDQVYAIHGLDPASHDPSRHTELELYHPDDQARIRQQVVQAAATGLGFDLRARITRASDGEPRILSYQVEVERDGAGRAVALVGVVQDVTEAETARRRIEESEARYRLIADSAKDVIVRFDTGGIRYISESMRRYGHEPAHMIGRSALELIHPDDVDRVGASVGEMFISGDADLDHDRTFRMMTGAGEAVWMESSPSIVRDADGAVVEMITILRDITDRKAVEEALERSEARYRLIADSAKDVIVKFDPGGIRYVSESARRYGLRPEDLIGKPPLSFIHPDDQAKVAAITADLFAHGDADPGRDRTYRIVGGDGEPIWVEGAPSLVRDADGKVIAAITLLRDIADRRATEQALAQSEAKYRRLADSPADVFVQYNATGIQYVSESVRRYGYAPDDLIGRIPASLVHPDDHAKVEALNRELLTTGRIEPGTDRTCRFITASGEAVWIEGSPSILRNDAGASVGVINLFRDISDRVAAAHAVAESEARYRLLAENSTDVIGCYGPDAVFTFMSPAIRQVLGYEPEDLVGRYTFDFMHPDDVRPVAKLFAAYLTAGPGAEPIQFEYRARHRDGHWVWLEAHPKAIYDGANGDFVEFQDTVRDISERKAVQAALADSEARYQQIADYATDWITRTAPDGRIVYLSPSTEAVTGYKIEELLGQRIKRLVHPDDFPGAVAAIGGILAGKDGGRATIEYRLKHKSGAWIWLQSNPTLVRDAAGDPVEFVDVTRDITERRATQAALAESEIRYRQISDHASDWITRTNAKDGRLVYLSPSTEAVTGYPIGDLLGTRLHSRVHPEDFERVKSAVAALLASDKDTGAPIEYRLRHKSGDWIWLEGNPTLVRDAAGEPVEFVDVTRNITVHKQLELELHDALDKAEAAADAKSEFLSNMSHELRTPLTSIIGFSSLLRQRSDLPGDAPRYAARIATASDSLLMLVNDILDFSKLEAGQVNLERTAVCPRDLAQELVELFEMQAEGKGVDLRMVAPVSLPDALSMDPTRVRQVMSNLVSNALKFTEQGSVTVELSYEGGQLSVAVTDTGAGVPADHLDRLFKRFSQVDASTTRTHGGTGLGLAICQGLVEAMGGEIGVTSVLGEGSVFHFRIPAPEVEAPAEAGGAEDAPACLAGLRVLVVDDNPANRELARMILETQDVEVAEAIDGQSALELAMSLPYDVILMDIRMPGMDGPTAVERLRDTPGPNQDIPILAFSADGDLARLRGLTDAGFSGVAHKPIVPSELITVIAQALDWESQDDEEAPGHVN